MRTTTVKLGKRLTCLRCGKVWLPRKEIIRLCPHCKSTIWNVPKPLKGGGEVPCVDK